MSNLKVNARTNIKEFKRKHNKLVDNEIELSNKAARIYKPDVAAIDDLDLEFLQTLKLGDMLVIYDNLYTLTEVNDAIYTFIVLNMLQSDDAITSVTYVIDTEEWNFYSDELVTYRDDSLCFKHTTPQVYKINEQLSGDISTELGNKLKVGDVIVFDANPDLGFIVTSKGVGTPSAFSISSINDENIYAYYYDYFSEDDMYSVDTSLVVPLSGIAHRSDLPSQELLGQAGLAFDSSSNCYYHRFDKTRLQQIIESGKKFLLMFTANESFVLTALSQNGDARALINGVVDNNGNSQVAKVKFDLNSLGLDLVYDVSYSSQLDSHGYNAFTGYLFAIIFR